MKKIMLHKFLLKAKVETEETLQPRTQFEWARFWWQKGFNVIPLLPKSKRPTIEWKNYEKTRVTEEDLNTWFNIADTRNIGGICGGISQNLTVIDFDDKKLFEKIWGFMTTKTLCTQTGKGIHVFIKTISPEETQHLRENYGIPIDIQSEGAYVVLPPSTHPTATTKTGEPRKYEVISETLEILKWEGDFEEDFFTLLKQHYPKFKPTRQPVDIDKLLAGTQEGERNNAAIQLATWYRVSGLDEETTEEKMQAWNEKNNPPLDYDELQTIIKSAYRQSEPYNYRFTRQAQVADTEKTEPLTPELEASLKDPNLAENIRATLGTTIKGEAEGKSLLYYTSIGSSIFPDPFGVIKVDRTGTGKSYEQRKCASQHPPERIEQPTSITEKVVNYLQGNYHGKVVRIDELFAQEEGMPYIRVWMTKGRLEHWTVDPDTRQPVKLKTEGCPVFWTTTIKEPEEQYGSRNWINHLDTTEEQTKRIHHFQSTTDMLPTEFQPFQTEQQQREHLTKITRWILQNAKPVLIPFTFTFPTENPRVRRDRPRLVQLIKCIANVFQLQRKTITFHKQTYIIATLNDFNEALKVAEPFLRSSVFKLDVYCIGILEYAKTVSTFTAKQAQKKPRIPKATTYRKLEHLEERGYIETIKEERPKEYAITDEGKIEAKIEVAITDDGVWLTELYPRLDDPEVVSLIVSRLTQQEENNPVDSSIKNSNNNIRRDTS
jgi:DNA-binding PadR family transcriptional regulator